MMKKLFFVIWILSFMSAASSAKTIESIRFIVGEEVDVPELYEIVGIRSGDEYTLGDVDVALERLGQTGRFRYLEARVQKNNIYFVLRPTYKIGNININVDTGSNEDSDLKSLISSSIYAEIEVRPGDLVDLGIISELKSKVTSSLESRGFFSSESIVLFEEQEDKSIRNLIINVSLSAPEKLKEINFSGFSGHQEKTLKDDYQENLVGNAPRFDFRLINSLLEKFQDDLREDGFYDSKVDYSADVDNGIIDVKLEQGKKYRVDIEGSVQFWERRLRDKVLQRVRSFSVPFDPDDISNQIRTEYLSIGYKDVQVNWELQQKDSINHYIFSVQEGKQYFLGEVIFRGGVGRQELDDLESAEYSWVSSMSTPLHFPYFDEKLLLSRSDELLSLIRDKGYYEAKILSLNFDSKPGASRIDLIVDLQIGQKFYINSISYSGVGFVDEAKLDALTEQKAGEVLVPSKIIATIENLKKHLSSIGFVNAELVEREDRIINKKPTSSQVDLVYQVSPGSKLVVGKLIVEGNERTKTKVVERELYEDTLEQGKAWNLDGEKKLRENLLSLGVFGAARVDRIGGRVVATDPEYGFEVQQKDLKISLAERPAGSIEFGPGYRTDLGIIGFAEFNYRNVFSENYGFLTRAQASRRINDYQFLEQRYSVVFLDPYFLNQRLRFRTAVNYLKDDDTIFSSGVAVRGFGLEETNLAFGLEFKLSEDWSVIQNLYTISLPRLFNIIDVELEAQRSERYRIATTGTNIIYDTRNNVFNPVNGMYSETSFQLSSPQLGSDSDVNFVNFSQSATFYYRTAPGSVIALSGEYSRVWGFSDSTRGVPANRRLFLGGQSSLRFLPERALRFDDEGIQNQHSFLFKAEYRQPWIFDMSIAFFSDVGRLMVLDDSFGSDYDTGWRTGAGVGVRYSTPVGPIALDFAFNLEPEPEESNYQIQFSIGVF